MNMISEQYRKLNEELHQSKLSYGVGGHHHADKVKEISKKYGCKTILDYGCGKATLSKALRWSRLDVENYDPAIPEYMEEPDPSDMIVCTDVLEHIEPECLDEVLYHLYSLAKKVIYVSIATRLSKKTLSDGRNAHLITWNADQWLFALHKYFKIVQFWGDEDELYAILTKK